MGSQTHHKPALSNAYPRSKPSPRRAIKSVSIAAAVIFILFFLLTSSPVPATVSKLPVFRPTAHQPPVQPNSTSGEAKWYNDWKWHNPFSSSITQDDTRSVLPPLRTRPPIYAFYDGDSDKNEATKSAEAKLLLIWRRAWWAQGFKPVILGRAEGLKNPLYEVLQGASMEKSLETDFVRWLAWGTMGTGILANWLALPMGAYDDNLLSYLRRGEYPKLTRYEGLGVGLFSGNKAGINAAVAKALKTRKLPTLKSILDAIPPSEFTVDSKPEAIAFYESSSIGDLYKPLVTTLSEDKPAGLRDLARLITSHLHLSFLNTFPAGITVLTPYESSTSLLSFPAKLIAQSLAACPPSPIPASCPPNQPRCIPCLTTPIATANLHSNVSNIFTIGTIPHPYTLTSLLASTQDLTIRYIRRDTDRDRWLSAVTEKTLGKEIGGPSRIVTFKETVASEWGTARGLWMTEDGSPSRRDLEWRMGFALGNSSKSLSSDIPTTMTSPSASKNEIMLAEKSTRLQKELIASSLEIVNKGKGPVIGIRDAVEAWNMADTEAWRFVRAFAAREVMERRKWEDEERSYAGGKEEDDKSEGWWRWIRR
ncbi:hypothetical protein MMC22_010458 [Lobaria immixta]|nr:hypothetical protein [Lobaria immixta]